MSFSSKIQGWQDSFKWTYLLGDSAIGIKQKDYSEETAREIDTTIREMIDNAYTQAKSILEERAKDVEAGVQLLLERETITPDDFPALEPVGNTEVS